MSKIILNLAMSLDGFIEGQNGEYDWCFTDQDYGMTKFLEQTDAILLGRKSYETLMQYDSNAYPNKTKYVFSRTLKVQADKTVVIKEVTIGEINKIKTATKGNIWLFGGAELTAALLSLDLIDELQIAIHPVVLGRGKPLFKDLDHRIHFKVIDTKVYSSGLVQVFYQPEKSTS